MPVGRGCRPGPTVTHGVWAQQPGLPPGQEPQSVSVLHIWNSFVEPVSQIFGPATTVCRYAPAIGWPGTMDSHEGAVVLVVLEVVVLDDVDVLDDVLVVDDVDDVVTGALVDVDVLDVVPGALVDVDVLDVVAAPVVVVVAAAVVVVAVGEYIHAPFGRQGLCAQDSVAEQRCPWVCLLQLAAVNWPHVGSPSSRKQQVLPVGLTA